MGHSGTFKELCLFLLLVMTRLQVLASLNSPGEQRMRMPYGGDLISPDCSFLCLLVFVQVLLNPVLCVEEKYI